jgi:hypothetical protein
MKVFLLAVGIVFIFWFIIGLVIAVFGISPESVYRFVAAIALGVIAMDLAEEILK